MISRLMLVIVISFCASGCGTLFNVVNYEIPPQPELSIWKEGPVTAPRKIYGGVSLDMEIGKSWIEDGIILPTACLWLVDVPLSAVGDTLTLPLTIRAAIDRSIENYYFRDQPADQASQSENDRGVSFRE